MHIFLIFSVLFSSVICSLVPTWEPNLVRNQKSNKDEVLDVCTNSTYSDPDGGTISSPNYPGFYSDNLTCAYLIDLSGSADTVLLKFFDFDTETTYDTVKVYDGSSVNDMLLLNASGSRIPRPLTSSTAQMLVTFTTDGSWSGYSGFLATYTNGGSTGCGKTYTDLTGDIASINYPGNYEDDQDCRYSIDLSSSGTSSVNLTFVDFQTEGGADFVYVYEGLTTSGVLLLKESGSAIPSPVTSRTSQILVRFTSNVAGNSYRGFRATYLGI